jgi:magnesium chelatase subunit I
MKATEQPAARTLGELRASGYAPRPIHDELRENLIARIADGTPLFQGVLGYEDTVIPQVERAVLAGHSMNLLGLRGQAKTRMARGLVDLLDEWVPVVPGSVLNEDPLAPVLSSTKQAIAAEGDAMPIGWLHRSDRYVEKLATPDVSVADLIGDVDPIKAANLKLDYSDERVIAYGLIPRSHRCIFVINELPDLQPRIQVALFNILQERDIQIRGFRMRLGLDLQFVFTANPEDYTSRGAIITPLKDRIQSQILTHYPTSLETAGAITAQEAQVRPEQRERVAIDPLVADLLERVAFAARDSEYIDENSGVSARLTITAYEHLVAGAELRILRSGEPSTVTRVMDLLSILPAVTGKVELVYEGEREGPEQVALHLIGKAIRGRFPETFPDPELVRRKKMADVYAPIVGHFATEGLDLLRSDSDEVYTEKLASVPGLADLVNRYVPGLERRALVTMMEFVLHGLAEHNLIGKSVVDGEVSFSDLMSGLFSEGEEDEDGFR